MSASMNHSILSIRSLASGSSTPQSSRYPSAYPSEDEDEEPTQPLKCFRFLELPSELRNKIYGFTFCTAPRILDLDPDNFRLVHKKLSLFFVSKQVHAEASHHFYSTHTVRLFPTHPGRFFKTKKPLLARLSPRYCAAISTLELRLGPGWGKPPRGWVVNDTLGLKDCINVRVVKVFIQIDPSDAIFTGFRAYDGFYEKFCKDLLDKVLSSTPSVSEVQFDGWSPVKKDGPMTRGLRDIAAKHKKMISWGPERGWKEEAEDEVWTESLRNALPTVDVGPQHLVVACPA